MDHISKMGAPGHNTDHIQISSELCQVLSVTHLQCYCDSLSVWVLHCATRPYFFVDVREIPQCPSISAQSVFFLHQQVDLLSLQHLNLFSLLYIIHPERFMASEIQGFIPGPVTFKSKFHSLEEEVKDLNSGSGGGTHKENHQVLYFTTNNALYSFNT